MDLTGAAEWRHCFDTADGGGGEVNQGFGPADAFIDLMEREGVRPERALALGRRRAPARGCPLRAGRH
jgi:hypothetical protein